MCELHCINVKVVLKLACKYEKDPLDCLQVPEVHICLMKDERMDHYLFYDLTLTTSCVMANVLVF